MTMPNGASFGRSALIAVGAGFAVVAGFCVVSLREPAAFEARGEFSVEAVPGALHLAGDSAPIIERAVLDPPFLERLAQAGGAAADATEGLSLAARIRIESLGGGRYRTTCQDGSAPRARKLCELVLEAAVNRSPVALSNVEATRSKARASTEALVSLMRQHPELVASAPPGGPSAEALQKLSSAVAVVTTARAEATSATKKLGAARVVSAVSDPVPLGRARTALFQWAGIGAALAAFVALLTELWLRRGARLAYAGPTLPQPGPFGVPRSSPPSQPPRAPETPVPPPRTPLPPVPTTPLPPRSAAQMPNVPRTPLPSAPPPAPPSAPEVTVTGGRPPEAAREPTTILPPPEQQPAKAPSHAPVTYESSNLDARQRVPIVQASRTTQMLGSPTAPPGGVHSSVPPSLRVKPGSATTRYSFVSTPPPAGGEPVRPHDVGPDWKPDPELDPAPCRPLCRELFAFGVEHCFVIGVTAVPDLDHDKSEFAASLALALSATGHARVLLVDADLDRPAQHRVMRAEMPPGATFSRQIQAHMTRQGDEYWSVLRCTKSLHVLVDGPDPSPGLVMSRTFEECVRALRAYYDFIVVDGPPGSRESECRALDGVIDGLIVVCTEATRAAIPETSRYFTTKRFSKAIRATR